MIKQTLLALQTAAAEAVVELTSEGIPLNTAVMTVQASMADYLGNDTRRQGWRQEAMRRVVKRSAKVCPQGWVPE